LGLISFDLDGVLQRNPFRYRDDDGIYAHLRRQLAPYAAPGQEPAAAQAAAQQLIDSEHFRRMASGDMVAAHDWDGIVAAVAAQIGYPGTISVRALVEQYVRVPGLISLYEGAAETLDRLAAAGHVLVAITNGFEIYQAPTMRELGVLDRFGALICPDNTGAGKPDPAVFAAARRHAPPGAPAVHIGDVLAHDIAGARHSGWHAVLVDREVPEAARSLPPWERPGALTAHLQALFDRQHRWHAHPPALFAESMPNAVVVSLAEVPATVEHLFARG
jgi:putative hydrolase of the HAD superfamily